MTWSMHTKSNIVDWKNFSKEIHTFFNLDFRSLSGCVNILPLWQFFQVMKKVIKGNICCSLSGARKFFEKYFIYDRAEKWTCRTVFMAKVALFHTRAIVNSWLSPNSSPMLENITFHTCWVNNCYYNYKVLSNNLTENCLKSIFIT